MRSFRFALGSSAGVQKQNVDIGKRKKPPAAESAQRNQRKIRRAG